MDRHPLPSLLERAAEASRRWLAHCQRFHKLDPGPLTLDLLSQALEDTHAWDTLLDRQPTETCPQTSNPELDPVQS
jgi:hypothetical protein